MLCQLQQQGQRQKGRGCHPERLVLHVLVAAAVMVAAVAAVVAAVEARVAAAVVRPG
jgi:hypothetical protein